MIAGAVEAGAQRILLGADRSGLALQAASGLDAPTAALDGPLTSSHLDSVTAAREMWKEDADVVVVLGGDGTCRDVAAGWPNAPMIPISTGTNNVFPCAVDGTSAGVAAGLVATPAGACGDVAIEANRLVVSVDDTDADTTATESALVDVALVDARFGGARAVTDPRTIVWVVAAIAEPTATGLAAIAGRVEPVGRNEPGGVVVRTGAGGRRVRVPLAPGTFTTLGIESVETLAASTPVVLPGGGMLAFDGERTKAVSASASISVSIEPSGPQVIDVDRTLAIAAAQSRFDVTEVADGH